MIIGTSAYVGYGALPAVPLTRVAPGLAPD